MFKQALRSPVCAGIYQVSINLIIIVYFFKLSSSLRTSASRVSRQIALGPTLYRLLSQEARSKLEAAVKEKPLVVFMKGTPELPQCGFSRAVIQLLDINGVPPEKMKTYDVLDNPDLRNDIKEFSCVRHPCGLIDHSQMNCPAILFNQRMADGPSGLC